MSWDLNGLLLVASTCTGVAVAGVVAIWSSLVFRPRTLVGTRYEDERRQRLRAVSNVYRWFEPLIDELARLLPGETTRSNPAAEVTLGGSLKNAGADWSAWSEAEFRATKQVEGILVGGAVFLLVSPTGYLLFASVLGMLLVLGYPALAVQSLNKSAAGRLRTQRLRLPMVVDQISLMMQAGANFEESLRTIVEEDAGHPLCVELAQVLHEIDAGRTRRDALMNLRDRIPDSDVAEIVFAITKGEELGTPLSTILSEQAEQMRLKRSQWGEKAAAEAEVQIVFPGMLVMIACLIVIIAPILLPAAFSIFE